MKKNNEINNSLDTVKPSVLEIISPPLWFPGYSVYRTAFCKKWLALIILDPKFQVKTLCVDTLFKSLKTDWDLHHYPNISHGLPIPAYPQLYQFDDAVKYFYYKNVVIDSVKPSVQLLHARRILIDSTPKTLQHPFPKKGILQNILELFTKKII
jgi:hypothetical protein